MFHRQMLKVLMKSNITIHKRVAKKTFHIGLVSLCLLLKFVLLDLALIGCLAITIGATWYVYSKFGIDKETMQWRSSIASIVMIWPLSILSLFVLIDVIEKFKQLPEDVKKLWTHLNKQEKLNADEEISQEAHEEVSKASIDDTQKVEQAPSETGSESTDQAVTDQSTSNPAATK